MLKLSKLLTGVFIGIGFSLIADGAVLAQSLNYSKAQQQRAPDTSATGNPVVVENLTFSSAFDVKQIVVRAVNIASTDSSTFAPWLKTAVKDLFISGDRWSQRTYCIHDGGDRNPKWNPATWDVRGIGRGDVNSFTGETDVFRTGSEPIECLVEIRYADGVSVFPAGMAVRLSVPSGYTLTSNVRTTLVPLP